MNYKKSVDPCCTGIQLHCPATPHPAAHAFHAHTHTQRTRLPPHPSARATTRRGMRGGAAVSQPAQWGGRRQAGGQVSARCCHAAAAAHLHASGGSRGWACCRLLQPTRDLGLCATLSPGVCTFRLFYLYFPFFTCILQSLV